MKLRLSDFLKLNELEAWNSRLVEKDMQYSGDGLKRLLSEELDMPKWNGLKGTPEITLVPSRFYDQAKKGRMIYVKCSFPGSELNVTFLKYI